MCKSVFISNAGGRRHESTRLFRWYGVQYCPPPPSEDATSLLSLALTIGAYSQQGAEWNARSHPCPDWLDSGERGGGAETRRQTREMACSKFKFLTGVFLWQLRDPVEDLLRGIFGHGVVMIFFRMFLTMFKEKHEKHYALRGSGSCIWFTVPTGLIRSWHPLWLSAALDTQ